MGRDDRDDGPYDDSEGNYRSMVECLVENFDKLKSQFSYLKTFQESGGTPEEIANAQAKFDYALQRSVLDYQTGVIK